MKKKTFQNIIKILKNYWYKKGCIIIQPLELEVGAATTHPMTFFNSLGSKPISAVYIQPSRRPTDGYYNINTYSLQRYFQLQVIIKPPPNNIQELYLKSLNILGLNIKKYDIRFIEDNWENPTLGASGLGWEVWLNGLEITQITYFQQMGGLECYPITVEITYGLERIAMYIQKIYNIYDIIWSKNKFKNITYGEMFYNNELEYSKYNFKYANINCLLNCFKEYKLETIKLLKLKKPLPIPAYEYILKSIHIFNILDARKAISPIERQRYILAIRTLSKKIAKIYSKFYLK
ncbi:MAG: glycine--tRNA ligase subunit alpha [Enterobacteriaceae bacterium PSpicST2]|nr:MAG: glycine--tRNA ligase subunit alpha [Enterobacteriaceae bacterium PSpicST2]WMC18998.1 MAG: glycine--tRNA ligase subunit alpha [Enterobacteriaceae bacterium PSpicST1]